MVNQTKNMSENTQEPSETQGLSQQEHGVEAPHQLSEAAVQTLTIEELAAYLPDPAGIKVTKNPATKFPPTLVRKMPIDFFTLSSESTGTYGDDEDVSDLVQSIMEVGEVREPVICTEDGETVGGNRRIKAARICGLKFVPAIFVTFKSEAEKLQAMLDSNIHRVKTFEQTAREAMLRKKIEAGLARGRQATKSKQQDVENLPEATGSARDITAKHYGISGKTLEKAIKVIEAMDALKAKGKTNDAKALSAALEKSVDGALKLAQGQATPAKPKPAAKTTAATKPAPAAPKGDEVSQAPPAKPPGPPKAKTSTELDFNDPDHAWDILQDSYASYLRIKASGFTTDQRNKWRDLLKQLLGHFTK